MSKYAPLAKHLRGSSQTTVGMTFDEIECILGTKLPPSAFKHRAWWSNNPTNSVITNAWLEAGYKTANVDMLDRTLEFRRFSSDAPSSGTSEPRLTQDGKGTFCRGLRLPVLARFRCAPRHRHDPTGFGFDLSP